RSVAAARIIASVSSLGFATLSDMRPDCPGIDGLETGMSPAMGTGGQRIRVAAAGDVHADESRRADLSAAFAGLRTEADLVLLAGDLTTLGDPAQAAVLADAARDVGIPVFAVLGNHDWHANRVSELVPILEDAGITVLERSWATCETGGARVGIAGTKGFVGGFPGSHLPNFGEPLLRQVYAEASA